MLMAITIYSEPGGFLQWLDLDPRSANAVAYLEGQKSNITTTGPHTHDPAKPNCQTNTHLHSHRPPIPTNKGSREFDAQDPSRRRKLAH